MKKGSFRKIGASTRPLYGPRAMLACGYAPEERGKLIEFFKTVTDAELPVIFPTGADSEATLQELLARSNPSDTAGASDLDRALILSGITEKELQKALSAYKTSGLPSPLWATLTPISEKWTLAALLAELNRERLVIKARKGKPGRKCPLK